MLRERAHEVVAYVRFLRVAVERDATVTATPGQRLAINKNLTHTLKANLYLLLYSTVEACMTQLVEDMATLAPRLAQRAKKAREEDRDDLAANTEE